MTLNAKNGLQELLASLGWTAVRFAPYNGQLLSSGEWESKITFLTMVIGTGKDPDRT